MHNNKQPDYECVRSEKCTFHEDDAFDDYFIEMELQSTWDEVSMANE